MNKGCAGLLVMMVLVPIWLVLAAFGHRYQVTAPKITFHDKGIIDRSKSK